MLEGSVGNRWGREHWGVSLWDHSNSDERLTLQKSFHVWSMACRTAYTHGLFKNGEEKRKM